MEEMDCLQCESHITIEKQISAQEVTLKHVASKLDTLDGRLYHIFVTLFLLCVTTMFSLAMMVVKIK